MRVTHRIKMIDPPSAQESGEAAENAFEQTGRQLRTLLSVRVPRPEQDPRGVAALCHAFMAVCTLGEKDRLPETVRDTLAHGLDQLQDPATGLYSTANNRQGTDLSEVLRTTQLALRTLRCLDRTPLYPLTAAKPWTIEGPPEAWLAGETRADATSIEVLTSLMHVLVFFAERHDDDIARSRLHGLLDGLCRMQDPETGLWGNVGMALADRIIASARIAAFFEYVHRPVQRVGRLAANVLSAWPVPEQESVRHSGEFELCCASLLAMRLRAGREPRVEDRLLRWRSSIVATTEGIGFGAAEDDDAPGAGYRRVATIHAIDGVLAHRVDVALVGEAARDPVPGYAHPLKRPSGRDEVLAHLWMRPLPALDARLQRTPVRAIAAVVVPCKDQGRYLYDTLRSIAVQSLAEIDIVVVDHGSTDDYTRAVLERWATRGLHVIRQDDHGPADARNRGIRVTQARYVCCVASGDRITPEYLEQACDILDTNARVGFVTGHTQCFDESTEMVHADLRGTTSPYAVDSTVQAAVFRRSAWEMVGGFWSGFAAGGVESWDLWLAIRQAGLTAELIPSVVWERRVRPHPGTPERLDAEEWASLARQLAQRHEAEYSARIGEVFGDSQREWAKLSNRAQALDRQVAMLADRVAFWKAAVSERDSVIEGLRRSLEEAEQTKAWWQEQDRQRRRMSQRNG